MANLCYLTAVEIVIQLRNDVVITALVDIVFQVPTVNLVGCVFLVIDGDTVTSNLKSTLYTVTCRYCFGGECFCAEIKVNVRVSTTESHRSEVRCEFIPICLVHIGRGSERCEAHIQIIEFDLYF